MAIRDHFRFGARKPSYVTSDAASGSSDRSNTSTKSNKSGNPLKLAKSFSWKTQSDSSSNSDDHNGGMCNTNDRPEKGVPSWLKKKNKKKDTKKITHPSEKPLTLVNIQHQEMLNHFTWTFGNRRDSYDLAVEIDGISPGTSRRPSFDSSSRPMPAGSPLAESGDARDGDKPSEHRRRDGHIPHNELFNSAFLSPDSASAFSSRRPAMLVTE